MHLQLRARVEQEHLFLQFLEARWGEPVELTSR